MSSPKISVVIPLFNKAPHVRRAVESVLRQSFADFEVVVVDDGSTDGGDGVVRSIEDERVRLIRQPNGGVSRARNRGIREARSDLVAFLDADDGYNRGFLAAILELASRHGEAGAYGTSFEVVHEDGRRAVWRNASLREAGGRDVLIRDYFRDALVGPVIWSSATAVPKKTFERVGLFPEGVRLGEDLDLWMRIGARYPIAVSGYVGAVYHRDASNRTDTGRIRGEEYELVRTGLRLLSSGGVEARQREHLGEYVSRYQITTAYHLVLLGERERARRMLRQCRTRRFAVQKTWWLLWTLIPTPIVHAAERVYRAGLRTLDEARRLRAHARSGA